MSGLANNFGLMMLSQRLRELSAARKKIPGQTGGDEFEDTTDCDTVSLLAESMSGDANSLIIVCVSSQRNATQSINALDFGFEFSKLTLKPRVVESKNIALWYEAKNWLNVVLINKLRRVKIRPYPARKVVRAAAIGNTPYHCPSGAGRRCT